MKSKGSSALAVVLLACGGVSHAANVTWTGATNSDWMTGTNWSNGTGPVQGDVAIINAGNVVFSTGTTPGYNALRHLGGALTFSGGTFNCANNSAWDSHVNATLLHTGTVATINELEIGRTAGANNSLVITIAQSGLGQFYQAISSDTLPATTWTNEGSILLGTGGQIQFTRPIAAGSQRKFFESASGGNNPLSA